MSINKKSPYTAAITGGGFLFEETNILLPLLQSEGEMNVSSRKPYTMNSCKSILKISKEMHSRSKTPLQCCFSLILGRLSSNVGRESVRSFVFVLLKTYKILFDFHTNVTIKRWNSISKAIFTEDLMMEFNEISANDAFVDSWSEMTKRKVASSYLTILRKIGMLDTDNQLQSLSCSNFDYYIRLEEQWFLEAALLLPYQIETIKKSTL